AVVERAREAVLGVPSETRAANPDGTTRYMRPRPGAARMYPETDIPPIVITPERVERVRSMLPEMPDQTVRRVVSKYGINEVLAWKLVDSGYLSLFERIASRTAVAPSFIAATLTETFVSLRRDGVDVEALTDTVIEDVFTLVDRDVMAKEAVPDVFRWLAEHPGSTAEEAVEELGLRMLSREEVADRVRALVRERMDLVRRLGSRAVKPLMGEVMRELRGRAKANMIYEILREELEKVIPEEG
ncbi:MAG TPA: Glu-tRNA(Gln) amidotransferase GatDE subunit E, partial [Candidatus Bathyarchaeota archaeon]|nr:Glu-tRNA(Gln) amidotransferase GatDE subunit E [Candidatus Bathyarchaeota archaeon]